MSKILNSLLFHLREHFIDKNSFLRISKGYNIIYLTESLKFNLNFFKVFVKSNKILKVEFGIVFMNKENNTFKLVYKFERDSFKNQIGNLSTLKKTLKNFNLKLTDELKVEDIIENFN